MNARTLPYSQYFQATSIVLGLAIGCILGYYTLVDVFLACHLGPFLLKNHKAVFFIVAYAGLFFFLLPAAMNRFLLGQKLEEIGFVLPRNKKQALGLLALGYLLAFPILFLCLRQESFIKFYSAQPLTLGWFILMQILVHPLYYFAEEFFFRGFILMNLWKKIGWHSYWVTELLFFWIHIFKSAPELIASFPLCMILNYIALKTRSVFPTVLLHLGIGVTANIWVRLIA